MTKFCRNSIFNSVFTLNWKNSLFSTSDLDFQLLIDLSKTDPTVCQTVTMNLKEELYLYHFHYFNIYLLLSMVERNLYLLRKCRGRNEKILTTFHSLQLF